MSGTPCAIASLTSTHGSANTPAPHGVSLAIEPHVGAALSTPAQALWLIEQVALPNVGLNLDYSHFQAIGMSVADAVPPLVPHALHTHIKGVTGRWPDHVFVTPGEDDFDHATYLRAMHDAGYRGFETVEISKMVVGRPGYEPFAHAQLAYDTLADAATAGGHRLTVLKARQVISRAMAPEPARS